MGDPGAEPLRASLGTTWGAIAVDMFFITSGFLITASFLARNNIIAFVWARILRIYPGLLMAVIFCVFVVGLFFTTNSAQEFLSDSQTYKFLIKNIILIFSLDYTLPGVFENNPYVGAVNGSLWTLPYEVKMYICLAVTLSILLLMQKISKKHLMLIIAGIASVAVVLNLINHFHLAPISNEGNKFIQLFSMFFIGAAFYVCRAYVPLSSNFFFIALVGLLLSIVNQHVFFVVYVLTLPYLIFYIAYIPAGRVRIFNNFGDYSYGLYIYAFPVQQSIAAIFPGISVGHMIISSFCVTMTLAFFSWHIVEKKCLRMKNNYVFIEKFFSMKKVRDVFL